MDRSPSHASSISHAQDDPFDSLTRSLSVSLPRRGVLGLLTELCLRYGWSADDVCGHREAPARLRAAPTSKTCPGRLVDCDEVRAELAAALAAAREGA